MDKSAVESAAGLLLKALFGQDILTDPNFEETPARIARAYGEILSGVIDTDAQVADVLKTAFPSNFNESITLTNHITYSMCPHHMLPVKYKVSLVYMPQKNGKVLGASKLGRLVDIFAHRAVLQETLIEDVISALDTHISPRGIGMHVIGEHMCMSMRGLRTQGKFGTMKFTGVYRDIDRCRNEALFIFQNGE